MTGKRFEYKNHKVYDNLTGETHSSNMVSVNVLNELQKENEWLLQCVKNQSVIINELDSTIMAYNMEHKITIKLTEKDLKTLDKALSYYTHGRCGE